MPEPVRGKVEHRWTTMLVNVDFKQPTHEKVRAAIARYLGQQLTTAESRTAFGEFCRQIWLRETAQFTAEHFNRLFNLDADDALHYGNFADYPTWDDIQPDLKFFLADAAHRVHVVVMNCTSAGKAAKQLYNQDPLEIAHHEVMELTGDHLWFVSGGNTISRGLTLLGLTASYFDRLRDGTCVDTVTQMGRWFGYRIGYELLPRLWMNADTVTEMKRIAVLEQKLHASIADNFAQHFSPADPAHYQQIASWGRQLSGRAFARRILDAVVGTIASTSEFHRADAIRQQIVDASRAFLVRCGAPVVRDRATYAYASSPLWECVPREEIQTFLEQLLPLYPEKSRRLLRGLLREISASENPVWDVVVGNPRNHDDQLATDVLGPCVNCATPQALPVDANILQFSAHILHPLAGYEYHKMDGRNAYCINGWAANEEARLGREFASAAIGILQREQRDMTSQELLDQLIAEQPKFRDFFTVKGELTALLTDEVLSANDFAVVGAHPITYRYQA